MPRACENGGCDICDHATTGYRATNQRQLALAQQQEFSREVPLSQPAWSDLECLLRDMREGPKCYGTAAPAPAESQLLSGGFNESINIVRSAASTDAAETVDEDLTAGAWLHDQPMSVDMVIPGTASAPLQQSRNYNGLSALSRSSSSMYEEVDSMSSGKQRCISTGSPTSGSTSSINTDVCCCMRKAHTCKSSSGQSAAAENFRFMQEQGLESATLRITVDNNMRTMLRKVMVNEGTLNQAIEICGGGTKGMKELMRRILFWVQEAYVESAEASAIVQGLEKLCMIKTHNGVGTPYEDHRSCGSICYSRADQRWKGLPEFHRDLHYQQYYGALYPECRNVAAAGAQQQQQQQRDHHRTAPLISPAFRSFAFADVLDPATNLFAYPAAAALHVGSRVVTTTKDPAATASTRAAHATARAARKSRMARQRGHNGPMQHAHHQASHNAMPGLSPSGPPACNRGSSWPSVPEMPATEKTRTPPDIRVVVEKQQQMFVLGTNL